jgi:cyanophycinase
MRIQALSALLCALLAISAGRLDAAPCDGPGRGKLLIHGGGSAAETYTNLGLSLCGGPEARVVVVGNASGLPDLASQQVRERYLRRWQAARARNVTILDLRDPAGAIAAVQAADYIFFDGGDQVELVAWMNRSPEVIAAIRQRHVEGALVGGMSAGAAVMSSLMIEGGDTATLTAIRSGGTRLGQGLAFWPEVITDQHFVRRQRFARLVSAVIDNPTLPGVAIDEETAILVSGGEFKVFGNGTVTVFDAREAQVRSARPGEAQSATDIRLSILRAGDSFTWRR